MNTIRIRGWNPKTKQMFYSNFYDCLIHINDRGVLNVHEYKEYGTHEETIPLILMQYTGFKDKNNKEIYTGDIILNKGFRNEIEAIESLRYFYWANYEGIYNEDYIQDIGNIYENPELLK